MDSSSIRGRYSLSTTNLANPIAESTCLNGLNSRTKFNWGEGTISPRSRNNSDSTAAADQSNVTTKKTNGAPSKVWMSPVSKIDPRTYVDIQSNGLASRIVKYHDNSTRLNRSLSMTNLYNKPGQFPVVHLRKNEQQYKAKKTKTLSMTRIAAPEKSVFHGNTLSSILRSGSIVGLQKSDEEISRENRPILHPPPSENDMAPTRSVLEVLKEISRKRINSDELDGIELTKKQCKDPDQDPVSRAVQRSKRQRAINNSSSFSSQISPEQQVIKKRMCNYNNDILSSLSSSISGLNKKKMFEMQSLKRTASELTTNASFSDFGQAHNEKHHCAGNTEKHTSASSQNSIPLSSHPSAAIQNSNDLDGNTSSGIVTRRASEPALTKTKPKLTLFNRDYDEIPTVRSDYTENKEDGDLCGIQFVKPKKSSSITSGGSLLLEKTKKSKLALMLSGLKGELDEEDEVDAVAPKEDQPKTLEAPVSTQSTSLPTISSSVSPSSSLTTPVTATSSTLTKPVTVTSDSATKDDAPKPALSIISDGFKLNSNSLASTTSTTQPTPVLPVESVAAPKLVTTSLPTSSIVSASNPIAGGFSFGLSDKSKTTPTTSSPLLSLPSAVTQASTVTLTTTSSTALPSSGTTSIAGTKPFTFGVATPQTTTTSSASGFKFGTPTEFIQTVAPNTLNILSSIQNTKAPENVPSPARDLFGSSTSSEPNFTFGSLAANTTISSTPATTLPTTTSSLSFGSFKNTFSSSSSTTAIANPTNGIVSFGTGNLPQTTTHSTGGFSFGLTPATEAPKSVFGNAAPTSTTTATTNSNTAFNFPAAKPAISAFSFGTTPTTSATTPVAAPNSTLTFGSTAASSVANASPPNIFGNSTNVKPLNTFTFGSSPAPAAAAPAPAQNSAFSFSATDKTKSTVPATGTSVGGFSFNTPSTNFTPVAESPKNIFGAVAPAAAPAAEAKPTFNFSSASTTNLNANNGPVGFGGAASVFGNSAPAPAPTVNSTFTFGTSLNGATPNQGATPAAAPNLFGASSNLTSSFGSAANGSSTMFGAQSSSVAPTPTLNFGSNSSNQIKPELSKPSGGFVFGSTSSIGNNASKPANAVDMNKTFVFGDANTTVKPVLPSSTTNIFGGGSVSDSTEKLFSFGTAPAAGGSNITFTAVQPAAVNPAPAFNFGAVAPSNNPAALAPANNADTQGPGGRVIKKATRRLHKA